MSKVTPDSIVIDGVTYVPESKAKEKAESFKDLKYCIVRSVGSGAWAGYVKSKKEGNVVMLKARRIWYWDGAASLSQLAINGTSKPSTCKFPVEVAEVEIDQVVEVIPATKEAQESINSVAIWSA